MTTETGVNNSPTLIKRDVTTEVSLALWPFEYQAVKNWRARQGLSTPMIEHPLMNSPMTTANCPDFSQWQRPEWFNPLVDFLAQRRPELAFLRHLFI